MMPSLPFHEITGLKTGETHENNSDISDTLSAIGEISQGRSDEHPGDHQPVALGENPRGLTADDRMKTKEEIKSRIEKLEGQIDKSKEKNLEQWGEQRTPRCFKCVKNAKKTIDHFELEGYLLGQNAALRWVLGEHDFGGGND